MLNRKRHKGKGGNCYRIRGVNCFILAATGMLCNYENKKAWVKVQFLQAVRAVSDGLNHNKTHKEPTRFYGVYKYFPYCRNRKFV